MSSTVRIGGAQGFYEALAELRVMMIEAVEHNDIQKQIAVYEEFLIFLYPYIESYMTDEEENNIDVEEIQATLREIMPENTDYEMQENNKKFMMLKTLLNEKRLMLFRIIARAGLYIPINPEKSVEASNPNE